MIHSNSFDSRDFSEPRSTTKIQLSFKLDGQHAEEELYQIDNSEYQGAPRPENDIDRVNVLCSLKILDTEREQAYEDITILCTKLFQLPIVLVSLVEKERQWFKSVQGIDATQTERKVSFCAWTLLPPIPQILVVENALEDIRFKNNYLVTGPPDVRFYAGSPLVLADGVRIGTLCLIDSVPRQFHQSAYGLLINLADLVVRTVERERYLKANDHRKASSVTQAITQGTMLLDTSGDEWDVLYANQSAAELAGISLQNLTSGSFQKSLNLAQATQGEKSNLRYFLDTTLDFSVKVWCINEEGLKVWLQAHFWPAAKQNPRNIMPKVGLPVNLEETPSEFDKYYFVLLDKFGPDVREDDNELSELTKIVIVQDCHEADVVAQLELGDLITAGKTWQLYRGIHDSKLVSIKVKLAGLMGEDCLEQLKRAMSGLKKKVQQILEHVTTIYECSIQPLPEATSAVIPTNYTTLFDEDSRLHVASSYTSSAPRSLPSTEDLLLAQQPDSPIDVSQPGSSPRVGGEVAPPAVKITFVQLWLLSEVCGRGTLADGVNRGWFFKLGSFNRADKGAILATATEIASGLAALHSVGITHLDLHASSIFLFPSQNSRSFVAKIGDHGLALSLLKAGAQVSSVCQPEFAAPEMLLRQEAWAKGLPAQSAQVSADVYSFGVNMWCLLQGKLPFVDQTAADIIAFYSAGKELPIPSKVKPDVEKLYSLVANCIATHPDDRYATMAQVTQALSEC